MCIMSVYTLLKVVDSVSDWFKKSLDEVGGWGELYPIFFGIFGIFLTLQSP